MRFVPDKIRASYKQNSRQEPFRLTFDVLVEVRSTTGQILLTQPCGSNGVLFNFTHYYKMN